MSAINITNARKELYNWNAIQETIYLNSIPGMVESIKEGMDTAIEDCVPEEDVEW